MAEVYEMMMKLSLHNAALTGLTSVVRRMEEIHRLSNLTHTSFVGWAGALKGALFIFTGGGLIAAVVKVLETAKEFTKEMSSLEGLGGRMGELVHSGAMDKKIFEVAKTSGQKVEDIAKIAGFASSIIDPENTMKALEGLSKYASAQPGGLDKLGGEPLKNVIRAGMITGRITDPATGDIDMKKLNDFLDEVQRLKSGTHGAFNEATLLGMAKQGGGFMRGLTTEGMEHMAIIAQSLGGPRTGTAFLGIYEQLARGQMTKKTAEGMEAAGLLKPGQWSMDKNVVKLDPETSKQLTAKFGGDPLALAKEIRENLIKQGITDPQEQMRMTANAFGRQTTRRFMAEEVADYEQMIGEGKRLGQGAGVNKMLEIKQAHDLAYNLERVQNAWHNLMVAIADPQTEGFILVLRKIEGVIKGVQDSVRGMDPESLIYISKGLTYLGIALAGAGAAAIIFAIGPYGWLIGAFTVLAAVNWEKMKGILGFVQTIIKAFELIVASAPRGDKNIGLPMQRYNILPKAWDWLTNPKVPDISPSTKSLIQPFGVPPKIEENEAKKLFTPSSFNPGEKKQILQPIQLNMNVDGRLLAQAVSEVLEDLYTHPTGPPDANGYAMFRPHGNYADT